MLANKWFLTMFACMLPLAVVLRIWDIFLVDSWEQILRIALAIVQHTKEDLLKLRMEKLLDYFDTVDDDLIDPTRLFKTSKSFHLDNAILMRLQELNSSE